MEQRGLRYLWSLRRGAHFRRMNVMSADGMVLYKYPSVVGCGLGAWILPLHKNLDGSG